MDFSLAFSEYTENLALLERSAKYIQNLRYCLPLLFSSVGWREVEQISAKGFENWRLRSRLCPKTKNEYRRMLSSFVNWLIDRDYLTANPISRVRAIPIYREASPRRALTSDEVRRLLDVAPPHRRLVYLTAVYTGLRRNELFSITWDDFTFGDDSFVTVPAYFAKSRKKQTIPLRSELAEILLANRPRKYHCVKVFKRFTHHTSRADYNRAGIPPRDDEGRRADFHSLRKSFCTFLFIHGGSPRAVQELMRHSDYKLTASCYTDIKQMDSTLRTQGLDLLPWIGA